MTRIFHITCILITDSIIVVRVSGNLEQNDIPHHGIATLPEQLEVRLRNFTSCNSLMHYLRNPHMVYRACLFD